jgi:hypothetical protein
MKPPISADEGRPEQLQARADHPEKIALTAQEFAERGEPEQDDHRECGEMAKGRRADRECEKPTRAARGRVHRLLELAVSENPQEDGEGIAAGLGAVCDQKRGHSRHRGGGERGDGIAPGQLRHDGNGGDAGRD